MLVHNSYIIENIKISPYQDENININSEVDLSFYSSSNQYPINNFYISDRMPSRGMDIISIEIIPNTYYPESNSLEVFTNIEISSSMICEISSL